MLKFLYFFIIVPILFCPPTNDMIDLFSEASMIKVYNNGQIIEMTEEEQNKFDKLFCDAISNSRQMPAFGVSLHNLTIEEMQYGIWVKFLFNKTIVKSEMSFDELLICVQKDCHGVNVIRGNKGRYEGRCYYLDLDKTLDDVYDYLNSLDGKQNLGVKKQQQSQEIEITFNSSYYTDNNNNSGDNCKSDNKNNVLNKEQSDNCSLVNYTLNDYYNGLNKSQKELLKCLN